MSFDPETTRIVRSWLDEGVTQLPDRVLDVVLDQVPATRQRRLTWWPAWWVSDVNTTLKLGLAAAVLAMVAVIGINVLGGTSNVGGPGLEPTTTPQASIGEPTASPVPSSTPVALLPEGPYMLSDDEFDDGSRSVAITVTIPAPGWYGTPGSGILENGPPEENFGPEDAGIIGPFVGDIYVPADPCRWLAGMPDAPATTVDEVVTALQSQASRDASVPVDITVDGHAGMSITLHVPDDAVFAECDQADDARFCTLTVDDPATCHRYHQFPGQIDELWIVDVNGEVVVIDAMWSDATPAEAVEELRAIRDSIAFGVP